MTLDDGDMALLGFAVVAAIGSMAVVVGVVVYFLATAFGWWSVLIAALGLAAMRIVYRLLVKLGETVDHKISSGEW